MRISFTEVAFQSKFSKPYLIFLHIIYYPLLKIETQKKRDYQKILLEIFFRFKRGGGSIHIKCVTFFIFITQTFNIEKCSKMFTGFRIIIMRITRLILRHAHDSKIHSLLLIHLGWVLQNKHQHNMSGLSGNRDSKLWKRRCHQSRTG